MPPSSVPSKQFLIRGGIALGIVAVILVAQTNWFHNIFHKTKKTDTVADNTTITDITSKDTNGNGIADWEEKLWGLDPAVLYTDGKPNAEIIKEKKLALGISTATSSANETDAIAQKLFTITTALSQNDNIDDSTLQDVANQLGSSVNVASISNKYSLKNITTVRTSTASLTAYYNSFQKIMGKYNLSQNDTAIIVQATETGDYSQLPQLDATKDTYAALAKELSTIKVPVGVAQYHLDIINSFAGTAASFSYLQQMADNGTQAIVGIALYKIYTTRGQTALYDLNDYLTKYGILNV
ncbi:MAG: hypothetical protein JWL92_97 [Candidatus Nomurabacteria bacterium]|nr:hypothetical protein [Candidatus Nomurabacteria bacterium]